MIKISQFVAMKIAEFYPKNTAMIAVFDDQLKKYTGAVCEFDPVERILGGVLYSMDHYVFNSEELAIAAMTYELEEAMQKIRILSN